MHDIKDMESMAVPSSHKRTGHDGKDYYIRTFSGKRLYYKHVEDHDYDIHDIAHALALKCRWGGHTKRFYSIAQHSVFTSKFVPYPLKLPALLHDASETYIPDFASPMKWFLLDQGFTVIKDIEKRIEHSIESKFGLAGLTMSDRAIIKNADIIALSTEHRDLMPDGSERDWMGEPDEATLEPVGHEVAERMFMDRYNQIMHERIPKWEDM